MHADTSHTTHTFVDLPTYKAPLIIIYKLNILMVLITDINNLTFIDINQDVSQESQS